MGKEPRKRLFFSERAKRRESGAPCVRGRLRLTQVKEPAAGAVALAWFVFRLWVAPRKQAIKAIAANASEG